MENHVRAMGKQTELMFREIQRFRQKWLWYFLISMFVLVFAITICSTFVHIAALPSCAKKPSPFGRLIAVGIGELITAFVVFGLFYLTYLVTEVRIDGLYIRFVPFHFSYKRIAFEALKSYKVRTYNPLGEYGGWGIRWGRNGWAYNVSGNRGVQLELISGKKILIGSQRPEDLADAIDRATGRHHTPSAELIIPDNW